jgi:hypothetical protein
VKVKVERDDSNIPQSLLAFIVTSVTEFSLLKI